MLRLLSVDGALNEERCVKIGRCRRSQEEKPSFDGEDRNVRINRLLSYSEAKTRTQQSGKVSLYRFQPVFCRCALIYSVIGLHTDRGVQTAKIACKGNNIRGKASVKSKSRERTALQVGKSVKQRENRLKELKEKTEAAGLCKSREKRMPMRFFR